MVYEGRGSEEAAKSKAGEAPRRHERLWSGPSCLVLGWALLKFPRLVGLCSVEFD